MSSGSRRAVTGANGAGAARARNVTEAESGGGRVTPPLDLPPPAERQWVERVGRRSLRLVTRRRALRGRGRAPPGRVSGLLRAGQEPGALG